MLVIAAGAVSFGCRLIADSKPRISLTELWVMFATVRLPRECDCKELSNQNTPRVFILSITLY